MIARRHKGAMVSTSRRVTTRAVRRTLVTAGFTLISLLPAPAAPPGVAARKIYRDASAAFHNGNHQAALTLLEKAVALRPDHPRYLGALARLQAVNDRPFDAIATLHRLAHMGIFFDPGADESFASLQGNADFVDVVHRLRANRAPVGAGLLKFELPAMTGIIEGIAFRQKTGDFFFGDARHRCVWIRRPDGAVRRFSPADAGLLGVLGLAIDEARGSLWAATTALPEMDDFQPADRDRAALVEFALADGGIRRVAELPADRIGHILGDLTQAPDGTVYATDSRAPVIWRLPPEARQPIAWVTSDEFGSLQGLAVVADGKALLTADYDTGMFYVDVAKRTVRSLAAPPNTTLIGIDGLVLAPDGSGIAVQNGIEPRRVVRLQFDPAWRAISQVEVLESGHPTMADPTLGTLADERFVFVGDAGWERFGSGGPADASAPRAVPMLATRVPSTNARQ